MRQSEAADLEMQKSWSHFAPDLRFYMIAVISVLLIAGAYSTIRSVMLLPAALCGAFIILTEDTNAATGILMFMLPFSEIFKLSAAGSSLYKVLEVAYIIRFFISKEKIRAAFLVSLALFAFVCGLSFIWSDHVEISRAINLVLWFIVLMCIFQLYNDKTYVKMGKGFIFGILLSCLVASVSTYFGDLATVMKQAQIYNADTQETIIRFMGLWNDPNTFAAFICLALTTNLKIYVLKKESAFIFIIYSTVLTIYGLLSLSKMCIVIVLVFWMVVILAKSGLKTNRKIVIVITIAITAFLLQDYFSKIVNTYVYRFDVSAKEGYSLDSLTTSRSVIWVKYLHSMRNLFVWIFGNGLNALQPDGRAAHNTYLQILYNVGLVGLISYISVFVGLIGSLNGKIKLRIRSSTAIDFLPVLVICIIAFFLDYFFIESFYFMLGLAILSIYAEGTNREQKEAGI